jgi:hypothetical protein
MQSCGCTKGRAKARPAAKKESPLTERTEESSGQHPIRVLIRDEDVGNVDAHSWMHVAPAGTDEDEGHGWKFKIGQGEDVEDQVYVMSVQPGSGEVAQGQANQGSFLRRIDPNDTEDQSSGGALLSPAGPDDVEAQGFRAGVLKPDASGSWTLELDDPEG